MQTRGRGVSKSGNTADPKPLISLLAVPCESGNYWKCDIDECTPCPQGFYQPQWGQTSCWPCPYNTTTDADGATQPTDCKREWRSDETVRGATDSMAVKRDPKKGPKVHLQRK